MEKGRNCYDKNHSTTIHVIRFSALCQLEYAGDAGNVLLYFSGYVLCCECIGEDGLTALNLVLPLFNLMNATG